MRSTGVLSTYLLGLVLAFSFVSIVHNLRPAPEDGVNGNSEFSLTQSGKPAFLFSSIPLTSDDSTAKDMSSAVMSPGPHHPAWDLLPIIRGILGVFIVVAALAICMIQRRKKDNSTGGSAVAPRPPIWRETADQHWGHMQARAKYLVVPHRPTYISAPAAGQITRVRAQVGRAVLEKQPLFTLAVDGGDSLIISTPAHGAVQEVAVVTGMRVAKDSWLAALETQQPHPPGAEAVVDPAELALPVIHPDAEPVVDPAQLALPVTNPGALPPQLDLPVVHPPQPAHRVVRPTAWRSSSA
ncbi:hypothetical protein COCOBI_15-0420 [Coccomyxa sp. Obi]|nr:hypothetical protein COCOBI_15-0420 [Coccomyxa sp. Obi]